MLGVNGKPFENIDHLIDLDALALVNEEILWGLAMTEPAYSEGKEYSRGDCVEELYDHRYKDVKYAEDQLTEEEIERLRSAQPNGSQFKRYLMYAKGAYFPWCAVQSLLHPTDWHSKHSGEGKSPTADALTYFQKTLHFCYSLPMFKEIGRIAIFGVLPGHHAPCHRDSNPARYSKSKYDHLVMFSPLQNKLAYIYDEQSKVKHYPNSQAYVFNDLDYHGADALPYFTYNFRVDGTYTDEFREQMDFGR